MKTIAVLFLVFLAFCGCENSSEPSLEERFSCKVDGKLFVVAKEPDNVLSQKRSLTIEYSSSSYFLLLIAENSNGELISVASEPVKKNDTNYSITAAAYTNKIQRYSSNPVGIITITKLDTINKKIAGTFYFTVKKQETELFNITEGKFNASYIPRN